jgi:hypothetical protein
MMPKATLQTTMLEMKITLVALPLDLLIRVFTLTKKRTSVQEPQLLLSKSKFLSLPTFLQVFAFSSAENKMLKSYIVSLEVARRSGIYQHKFQLW